MQPEQPAEKVTTDSNKSANPWPHRNAAQIPDHTLIRQIAEGSYGEIWLARNVMGTYRAVKILYRKRFDHDRPYEREYEGIKKFEPLSRSHDGFVDVLQIGRNDAEGYFYYVMELGDDRSSGQSFDPQLYQPKTISSEVSTRGRLPVEECLHLALTITAALSHLHNQGLTHRDIKPSNIIFVNGTPKLADIGLVADIGRDRSYVGTEGFIPPEGPGTPQADIFSLGKVLYEMSTGKDRNDFPDLPENFDTFPDASVFREFNEVVIRACHGDLTRRYPSAREMYAELAILLNGDSIKRLRLLERRLAGIKRMGIGALLFLVIGSLLAYPTYHEYKMRQENRERQVGVSITEASASIHNGNMPAALSSFTTALKLTEGLGQREEGNRLRCSTTLSQCPKLVQMGFSDNPIITVEFQPDGKRILATLQSQQIQFFDIESGQFVPPVLAKYQKPKSASFSPDGHFIVSVGDDKTIRLWDSQTGENIQTMTFPSQPDCANFSPDGKQLICGVENKEAWIWDTKSNIVAKLKGHTGIVRMARFSPDQSLIATASFDETARVWDNTEAHNLRYILKHSSWVACANFSPDGKYLATSDFDRQAHVWDLSSGQEVPPVMHHRDLVRKVEFSPDGRYLLTASGEGIVRIWDAFTHQPIVQNNLLQNTDRVLDAAFNREGNRIVIGCLDGTLRIWDFAGSISNPQPGPLYISPDGNHTVYASNSVLEIRDARTQSTLKISRQDYPTSEGFQLSADSRWLLTYANTTNPLSSLVVWDTHATSAPPINLSHPGPINNFYLSSGNLLACVYQKTNLQIWDFEKAQKIGEPMSSRWEINHAVFNRNNQQLLISAGALVHTVEPLTGKTRFPAMIHARRVNYANYNPNENQFITCISDQTWDECWAQIWDARTRRPVGSPLRHRDGVLKAIFNPGGTKIATASEDFTARIWSAATEQPLTIPLAHQGQVRDVDFSPDSRWLLTVSWDKTARLWDVETGEPLTPPITFPDILDCGRFLQDGYHIRVASTLVPSGNDCWQFDLVQDHRPISDWQSIAYLLSGSTWTSQQPNDQQAPDERRIKLQKTWQEIKSKYPNEFSTSEKEVIVWHEQEAKKAEQNSQWSAVIFHLNYLLSYDPQNSRAAKKMALARQKLEEISSGSTRLSR